MPGAVFTVVAASSGEAVFVDETQAEQVRPLHPPPRSPESSPASPSSRSAGSPSRERPNDLSTDRQAKPTGELSGRLSAKAAEASQLLPAEPPWRGSQAAWAALPVADRLQVLRSARHRIAEQADSLAAAISPELARSKADTMAAEILPLLEACKFLERNAAGILAPRKLGRDGLPFWLAGVEAEVRRVPYGKVLVIGPANYPLFLPGVQTLQALTAGNAVIWKPGLGGKPVAELLAQILCDAGLPLPLLRITEESAEAAIAEIDPGADRLPDKVFFTGSAKTGRLLLRRLAETATPCVMELSGCDAVIALPSADLDRLAAALTFGMRLNGSATCMAPRRLFLPGATAERRQQVIGQLLAGFDLVDRVPLSSRVQLRLHELLEQASALGATVHGHVAAEQKPILVENVTPGMRIAYADVFAPLLMVMAATDEAEILQVLDSGFYALTAAIFGKEREARVLAAKIIAGTVLVNDLIVPTADPRVPFGGRRRSGFGVTRGREGLLEMTAVKVLSVRQGNTTKHYEATTEKHEALFRGVILSSHAGTWRSRLRGLRQSIAAARNLKVK